MTVPSDEKREMGNKGDAARDLRGLFQAAFEIQKIKSEGGRYGHRNR
jgi:hypothetical protein